MTLGEWYVLKEQAGGLPMKAGALAMHAALLPTGQVLYFGGNERSEKQHNAGPGGWNHACIWTPDDGHVDAIPSPGFDLFCCGHCFLGSGQLLIVGGTEAYSKEGGPDHAAHGHSPGVRNAAMFDAALIDQVWHNEQVASPAQPGTGWTGWYAHGIAADRAKRLLVVQHDDGRLHAFMIGIDDRLRHNEQIAFIPPPPPPPLPPPVAPLATIYPGQTWTGWNAFTDVTNRAKYLTVAKHADGRLHAFMIGMDDQVWHNEQVASAHIPAIDWTGWNVLSAVGDTAKYLTVVQHTDGRLHAFRIGMDDRLWHIEQTTPVGPRSSWIGSGTGLNQWSPFMQAANKAKQLRVVLHTDGRLHAFMIGMDDQVWHNEQVAPPLGPTTGWTGWRKLSAMGDNTAKDLTVAQEADGRLHVFRIGMDNQVSHIAQTTAPPSPSSNWSPQWYPFNAVGARAKHLTVARHGDGRLHAFMIGMDNQVWHIAQAPAPPFNWSPRWYPLSGVGDRAKYLTVARHAGGRLHAFMIGMDNQVWHNEENASDWTGWGALSSSGDRAKSLVVATDDASRLHAFAIGISRLPWIDLPPMLPEPEPTVQGHKRTFKVTGGGRWYPTPLTLPDGRVVVMGGHPGSLDVRHSNFMVELFDPASSQWLDAGDEESTVIAAFIDPQSPQYRDEKPEIYPRMHVLPDGNVFCVALADEQSWLWNPVLFTPLNVSVPNEMRLGSDYDHNLWGSVLLPLRPSENYKARILAAGGMQNAYVFDLSEPYKEWQLTQRQGFSGTPPIRKFASLVLLPDSTVLMVGGTSAQMDDEFKNDQMYAVKEAEQFKLNPASVSSSTWIKLAPATVPRQYHSTALLLPDGRVWTGGSNPNNSDDREEQMEVFSPPYLFKAGPRPTIVSAPDRLQWNKNFTVSCSNPADISHAVLIRCGSATHGFDVDQRLVELQVDNRTNTNVVFKPLPDRNILPPGHYMLFALNANGVPSRAVIVRCDS